MRLWRRLLGTRGLPEFGRGEGDVLNSRARVWHQGGRTVLPPRLIGRR